MGEEVVGPRRELQLLPLGLVHRVDPVADLLVVPREGRARRLVARPAHPRQAGQHEEYQDEHRRRRAHPDRGPEEVAARLERLGQDRERRRAGLRRDELRETQRHGHVRRQRAELRAAPLVDRRGVDLPERVEDLDGDLGRALEVLGQAADPRAAAGEIDLVDGQLPVLELELGVIDRRGDESRDLARRAADRRADLLGPLVLLVAGAEGALRHLDPLGLVHRGEAEHVGQLGVEHARARRDVPGEDEAPAADERHVHVVRADVEEQDRPAFRAVGVLVRREEGEGVGHGVPDVHAVFREDGDPAVHVIALSDPDQRQVLREILVGLAERAVVHVEVGGLAAPLVELVPHHLAVVERLHVGLLDDLEVDVPAGEAHDAGPAAVAPAERVADELMVKGLRVRVVEEREPAAHRGGDLEAAQPAAHGHDLDRRRPDVDPVTHDKNQELRIRNQGTPSQVSRESWTLSLPCLDSLFLILLPKGLQKLFRLLDRVALRPALQERVEHHLRHGRLARRRGGLRPD